MAKNNFFLELILGTVTGALTTVGKSKFGEVLDQLHKDDPTGHKAALAAGKLFVEKLQPLVQKTATNIDDAVLNAIDEAVTENAKKHGIEL